MAIKPAIFNTAISRDSNHRRLDAEMASRKKGVSAGRQVFKVDGAIYTLKEMIAKTGKEGRAIQRRYSDVHKKRLVTFADFA